MSLSSVELWQLITANHLASPMQCRAWAAEAAAGLSTSESIDAARLAAQLVQQGKLTQFQADTLLSGSDQPLTLQGWRLLEPVNFCVSGASDVRSVWNDWWVAAKSASSSPMWLRWLSADDLRQPSLIQAHPALPLGLRHAQVDNPHLQAVSPPEKSAGTLQISVAPAQGKLLSSLCSGQSHRPETVIAILLECAAGLSALHGASIPHGRVLPDRIVQAEDGPYRLLRDPLCWTTMPAPGLGSDGRAPLGLLGSKLPKKLLAAHFMAPEFLVPAQLATTQTDCYSLGCIAWLLLTGNVPFAGTKPDKILAAHAEQKLNLSALANVPQPLVLWLLHCLAKNPAARFSDAAQLRTSLEEVQRVLAGSTLAASAPSPIAQPATPLVTQPARSQPVTSQPVTSQPVTSQPVTSQPVTSQPAAALVKAVGVNSASTAPAASSAAVGAGQQPLTSKQSTAPPLTTAPLQSLRDESSRPVASDVSVPSVAAAATATTTSKATPSAPVTDGTSDPNTVALPTPTSQAATDSESGRPPTTTARITAPAHRNAGPVSSVRKTPAVRSGVRRPAGKRKRTNPWLTPIIGGGALVILLLVVLVINGGPSLTSSSGSSQGNAKAPATSNLQPNVSTAASSGEKTASSVPIDPRAESFELVDSNTSTLWAPPRPPEPVPLNLLPPGGQVFTSIRPAQLFAQTANKQLLSLLDPDLEHVWQWLRDESGVNIEELAHVVIAAYPGKSGAPQYALRVQLTNPQSLSQMKAAWHAPSEMKVGQHVMLEGKGRAYYVTGQPLVESQSITEFAVGPVDLIREAVELEGAAAPLASHLEQLWQASDRQSEVCILLNPSFLFTEGRQWLEQSPARVTEHLQKWLSRDMRGAMFSTSLGSEWYCEMRLVGASDRDAASNQQKLMDAFQNLPAGVESWLVNKAPHPYWRALAMRYPSMLRALVTQTRTGAENGQAIANAYLPLTAAPNLIYASWMAVQPTATSGPSAAVVSGGTNATTPLTPEQILERPITVVIDQQSIEVVLQLIGDQANEKLPSDTKPLRFELDGSAFQRSGFTRNQSVRDFKVESKPVRVALTELAKVGNPITGITDFRTDEQKMIWVLKPGQDPAGEATVSLTSREAAVAAKLELPVEFTPPKS